jgi:ubiquinol-cytochrome c reductase cytochrome b subunit
MPTLTDMAEFKTVPADAPVAVKAFTWLDNRFPVGKLFREHMSEYYAPKNFNIWYVFGALSMLVLVIQIVTGIFLVMHYKPDAALNAQGVPVAFASVEYIMRDVAGGWFIRYMHSTGASAFFVVVYLHMFRGLLYGSYRKPRELIWIFGCLIFLSLMAEAFFGYLLPWGQMSYWGAQVIVNLFAAVPFVGPDLALLIRGDYVVGDATLNRFFAFHVIAIPLVLIGLVAAHITALHEVGSNNPDGVEIKANKDEKGIPRDGIPFHPFYTVHDILAVSVFCIIFFAIVFLAPELGGYFLEYNNFIPADPLKTPAHIAPVWYFTPFYSMLRATTDQMTNVFAALALVAGGLLFLFGGLRGMARLLILAVAGGAFVMFGGLKMVAGLAGITLPNFWFIVGFEAKFWGVAVMGLSTMILFALPWLDRSPAKSIRYRPTWHKWMYAAFVGWFFVLGYLGIQEPSDAKTLIAQIGTLFYFGFFLLMPIWSRIGTFKPVPDRVVFAPH